MSPALALNLFRPILPGAAPYNAKAIDGLGKVATEWLDFVHRRLGEDVRLAGQLAASRSPAEGWGLYADFLQQGVQDYWNEYAAMTQLTSEIVSVGVDAAQGGAQEAPGALAAAAGGLRYRRVDGNDRRNLENPMYKHILIATDGSELAGKAVAAGLELARHLKAKVTAVTATEPWSAMMTGEPAAFAFPIEEYEKAAAENAARILSAVREAAKKQDVPCETVHVNDFPAEAIIDTAKAKGCDLIVMASHGRKGVARMLLGSQAARVLTLSTIPVLVCR